MSAQVARDLQAAAAAAIIRRGGLCKGRFSIGGSHCALGALDAAGAMGDSVVALTTHVGRWIVQWNDAPERTAADVTCAMEAAATRANPPVLHAGAGLALTRLRGGL